MVYMEFDKRRVKYGYKYRRSTARGSTASAK